MRGGTVKQMLCMLAAAAASVLSAADFPRAVLELGGTWLVKPAESPEKLPDDGDWGRAKAVLAQRFRIISIPPGRAGRTARAGKSTGSGTARRPIFRWSGRGA